MDEFDATLSDVTTRVAARQIYSGSSKREADLVRALELGLSEVAGVRSLRREASFPKLDWTRQPGGVDLEVSLEGGRRALIEAKVGKPDEALWDALKLADIMVRCSDVQRAYLVYDGTASSWATEAERLGLFGPRSRVCAIRQVIARWPEAWMWLMLGGRGIRPVQSVSRLEVRSVGAYPAVAEATSIRVAAISPRDRSEIEHFDAQGWPKGMAVPSELRERVALADERRRDSQAEPAAGKPCDRCGGQHVWLDRWTQPRLDAAVPGLPSEAFRCVRGRLAKERGWTEDELHARVDPLRRGP